MSTGTVPTLIEAPRERFVSGWTGFLTLGLIIYSVVTIAMTILGVGTGPNFKFFTLFSDTPTGVGAALLAALAAHGAQDPSARRAWQLMAASLTIYSIGNLLNSIYWYFGHDPFPSVGDFFFLAFYPLVFSAILTVIRAGTVRVPWGRLALDSTILMLGFGAFFWFFVIRPTAAAAINPDFIKYFLTQTYIALNCIMVLAFGVLLLNSGAGPLGRRTLMLMTLGFSTMFLADIVWAMSKVTGEYLPGGLSDSIYLSCYVWLVAAAREQLRGPPPLNDETSAFGNTVIQGLPYIAMLVSFLVLVYFESGEVGKPTTVMTVIIFVLTLLVMLCQGVILRDDASLRERRAAGLVEARDASLIQNSSDVIMITDVQGRLHFVSPSAERTFSMHPDILIGSNLFKLCSEADRDRLAAVLSEVSATYGKAVGPVEVTVGSGSRRYTLECAAATCWTTRRSAVSPSTSATSASARRSRNSCGNSHSTIR
ncbi:MAG: PAS domain S-box protein [Gammaproteobacteria bacterium]|nr:PAS domain S-box protein [Gammaproteobacteria bacterium]